MGPTGYPSGDAAMAFLVGRSAAIVVVACFERLLMHRIAPQDPTAPQPMFELGGAGNSRLTQGDRRFPSKLLALPIRLLVNRSSTPRSSGYDHGPHLRLPRHCQACQRSLTRNRTLVQIQYRPPASSFADGLCDSLQVRSQPLLSAARSTARRWTSILTPFAPAQRSSSGHIPPVS
jgi:hypothetical protein